MPRLVLSSVHPPTPTPCFNAGLVDVVKRERGEHPVGPELLAAPPTGGVRSRCLVRWELSWSRRFHPGDAPFSKGHCHIPILHSISLQWSEQTGRALIKTRFILKCNQGRTQRGKRARAPPPIRARGPTEAGGPLRRPKAASIDP